MSDFERTALAYWLDVAAKGRLDGLVGFVGQVVRQKAGRSASRSDVDALAPSLFVPRFDLTDLRKLREAIRRDPAAFAVSREGGLGHLAHAICRDVVLSTLGRVRGVDRASLTLGMEFDPRLKEAFLAHYRRLRHSLDDALVARYVEALEAALAKTGRTAPGAYPAVVAAVMAEACRRAAAEALERVEPVLRSGRRSGCGMSDLRACRDDMNREIERRMRALPERFRVSAGERGGAFTQFDADARLAGLLREHDPALAGTSAGQAVKALAFERFVHRLAETLSARHDVEIATPDVLRDRFGDVADGWLEAVGRLGASAFSRVEGEAGAGIPG
ncbi:hypothetical protein [Paludibacterium paludis]|uniref:Uncharacterized protein n=1 Tax=Paludibacterium paludis TaxID=1225769 RepID=A0A918UAJ4_9NEIS|nr:hypothetical protein [Paludibacterium paludis]GGY17163.1 hypothetical protein GCM10011289_20640 [Paludibacterium paludis]